MDAYNFRRQKISDITVFGPSRKCFISELFDFNLASAESFFREPLRPIFNLEFHVSQKLFLKKSTKTQQQINHFSRPPKENYKKCFTCHVKMTSNLWIQRRCKRQSRFHASRRKWGVVSDLCSEAKVSQFESGC